MMQMVIGYKTVENAKRAGYFKANNGVEEKRKAKQWWNKHLELADYLTMIAFYSLKDGEEISDAEWINLAIDKAAELNITDFDSKYLLWL
jgi:hypothetical protein